MLYFVVDQCINEYNVIYLLINDALMKALPCLNQTHF